MTGALNMFTKNVLAASEAVNNSCHVELTNCQKLHAFLKDSAITYLAVFMFMGRKMICFHWRTKDQKVGTM